jgi:hypothetical protein
MFNYQPVNMVVNSLPSIYSAQLHFNYFYKWAEFVIYNTDKTVSFTSIISCIASPNALIALDNGASFAEASLVNDLSYYSFEAYATGLVKIENAEYFTDDRQIFALTYLGLDWKESLKIENHDYSLDIPLNYLAFKTGKVTREEANEFKHLAQVLALRLDIINTAEDALKFDNKYQVQALNLRSSITIDQALQFKCLMQVRAIIELPLSYRYISTEEILKFDNDDQVYALIKCSHLSYEQILQFTNSVQAEACEDGSLSFEDSLKFSLPIQLRAFNDVNLDIDKALKVTESYHYKALEKGVNIDDALQFKCEKSFDNWDLEGRNGDINYYNNEYCKTDLMPGMTYAIKVVEN